jgi:hypothetical protein
MTIISNWEMVGLLTFTFTCGMIIGASLIRRK